MTKKTIITGGAGFIGSHLARRLKEQGRHIVIIDNLSTGRHNNITALLDGKCEFFNASVTEALADTRLLAGVESIYHLAAAVGVKLVVDDPAGMIRTNIDETVAVLDAARQTNASVLIASSSEVYGKCPVLPLREDMELVYGPTTASRWAYAMTKALDEHLALDYCRTHDLRAVVVRLFNTIGPRQIGKYGMVVPRFVAKACQNHPIVIYGDGKQTRAFCDVRDVVRGMTGLVDGEHFGRVFNLGSNREVSVNDLAEMIISATGSTGGVQHIPYEEVYGPDFEDPPHRLPDVSRIAEAIGFKPAIRLEQTIEELINLQQCEASSHSEAHS